MLRVLITKHELLAILQKEKNLNTIEFDLIKQ